MTRVDAIHLILLSYGFAFLILAILRLAAWILDQFWIRQSERAERYQITEGS